MRVSIRTRRVSRFGVIVGLCVSLSACDLGGFITRALDAIGLASEKTVRISGETYFKLDKRDSKDGYYSSAGYLCVVHDPGCGASGNDGSDTFFQVRQLPPLATLVGFEFEPIPPTGMADSFAGTIPPSGSFDTKIEPGPANGSAAIRVRWHNTCWGPYGGKPAVYRVTLKVKIKGNLDLGDEQFDPAQKGEVPPCRSPEQPATTDISQPSGFLGSILVCNPLDPNSTLHLHASLEGSATGSNKATMSEDIPVRFSPQVGGTWVADFRTPEAYQRGTWTITSATLDGDYGPAHNLPRPQTLPGNMGEPVLDFRGGPCQVQ